MTIAQTTRKLIKPLTGHLAMLALVAGVAGMPIEALATKGESGRGEAPGARTVSTYTLQRLNDNALQTLAAERNVRVEGEMGRYNRFRLLKALRFTPDRTRRLIERIENARTDVEREAIVRGLLRAAKRRHKALEIRILKDETDLIKASLAEKAATDSNAPKAGSKKGVQDHLKLRDELHSELTFIRLLISMKRSHTLRK